MLLEEIYKTVATWKVLKEDDGNESFVAPLAPKGQKPGYESPDNRVKRVDTILSRIEKEYLRVLTLTERINAEIEKIEKQLKEIQKLEEKQSKSLDKIKNWGIRLGFQVIKIIQKTAGKRAKVVEEISKQKNTFVVLSEAVKKRLEELGRVRQKLGLEKGIAQVAIGVKIGAYHGKIEVSDVEKIIEEATEVLKLSEQEAKKLTEILDKYMEKNASLTARIELITISGQAIDNIQEALEQTRLDVRQLRGVDIKKFTIASRSTKITKGEQQSKQEDLDFGLFFNLLAENAEAEGYNYYEKLCEEIDVNLDYLLIEADLEDTKLLSTLKSGVKLAKNLLDGLRHILDNIALFWNEIILDLAGLIGIGVKIANIERLDAFAGDEFIKLLGLLKQEE